MTLTAIAGFQDPASTREFGPAVAWPDADFLAAPL
jgi:hypothetical protein